MNDFKEIPGWEGIYATDKIGNILGLKRNKIRATHLDKDGYMVAKFYLKGKSKTIGVHRAVAITHIGIPEKVLQVNHRDGIKTNNNVNNLEFLTPKENIAHAWATGLSKARFGVNAPAYGIISPNAIKIINLTNNIVYDSISQASKITGFSKYRITLDVKGKNKFWRYYEEKNQA